MKKVASGYKCPTIMESESFVQKIINLPFSRKKTGCEAENCLNLENIFREFLVERKEFEGFLNHRSVHKVMSVKVHFSLSLTQISKMRST